MITQFMQKKHLIKFNMIFLQNSAEKACVFSQILILYRHEEMETFPANRKTADSSRISQGHRLFLKITQEDCL